MSEAMDGETVLRHLFGAIATRGCGEAQYGAGVYVDEGVEYDICPMCVLMAPPQDHDPASNGKLVKYGDLPLIGMSDPGKMKPEVFLDADAVALTEAQAEKLMESGMHMIPALKAPQKMQRGLMMVSSYKQKYGEYEFVDMVVPAQHPENMEGMKLLVYTVPPDVKGVLDECGVSIGGLNPCIMQTRLTLQPVLVLCCDVALLYLPLCKRRGSDTMTAIRMKGGAIVAGDGWSDDQQSFKKLIIRKQGNMKGMLGNPVKAVAAAAAARKDAIKPVAKPVETEPDEAEEQVAAADIVDQADGTTPGVAAAVATRVDTSVKPAEDGENESVEDEEKEQPAAQAADQAAEAAPAEAAEQKPKAQRRQKPVAQGGIASLDLAEAQKILQVNIASIDSGELEEAQNALRTLRDILISATRLQTNIALAIAQTVKSGGDKTDSDTLAAIQKLLAGKK